MKNVVIPTIVLTIIVVIFGFTYLKPNKNISNTYPTPTQIASEDLSDLLQGGSSYSDPDGVYSFLYPNDYVIDSKDPLQVRVYKNGPTQKGQTEMYDGVIVNMGKVNLNGESLSEWVDSKINEAKADGVSEVVKAKASTTLNKYPGFSYTLRGLGIFETIVVQKDLNSDNAIVINTMVADPTNIGFQEHVDATLSTLQILK